VLPSAADDCRAGSVGFARKRNASADHGSPTVCRPCFARTGRMGSPPTIQRVNDQGVNLRAGFSFDKSLGFGDGLVEGRRDATVPNAPCGVDRCMVLGSGCSARGRCALSPRAGAASRLGAKIKEKSGVYNDSPSLGRLTCIFGSARVPP
jgi:hypothetical protein